MLSRSLGLDPDTPTYMEVISGREDFPCGALRIANEEALVVRERVPIRTERPSVREPGTNGNHALIAQSQNDGSSANRQEIPVSMDNLRPKSTEDQSITSADGESLGRNVNVRRSERIINYPLSEGSERLFMNRCRMFRLPFGKPQMVNPPQSLPY